MCTFSNQWMGSFGTEEILKDINYPKPVMILMVLKLFSAQNILYI